MIVGFRSEADAKRVIAGTRAIERFVASAGRRPLTGKAPSSVHNVRVTGDADESGLYPGEMVAWDEASQDYIVLQEIRIRSAGDVVPARFSGVTADGYGLYLTDAVGAGSGSGSGSGPPDPTEVRTVTVGPVLTGWACVGDQVRLTFCTYRLSAPGLTVEVVDCDTPGGGSGSTVPPPPPPPPFCDPVPVTALDPDAEYTGTPNTARYAVFAVTPAFAGQCLTATARTGPGIEGDPLALGWFTGSCDTEFFVVSGATGTGTATLSSSPVGGGDTLYVIVSGVPAGVDTVYVRAWECE